MTGTLIRERQKRAIIKKSPVPALLVAPTGWASGGGSFSCLGFFIPILCLKKAQLALGIWSYHSVHPAQLSANPIPLVWVVFRASTAEAEAKRSGKARKGCSAYGQQPFRNFGRTNPN
jgi:hypothetical protein